MQIKGNWQTQKEMGAMKLIEWLEPWNWEMFHKRSNKNIGRMINDRVSGWERIRVVLLGSKGTGKTVFMTSVADHLRNHNNSSVDLCGWSSTFDRDFDEKVQEKLNLSKARDRIFPFAEYRKRLANKEWPHKTRDCWSVLTVPFKLTKGGDSRSIMLEMLDLPGERVADFPMLGRSYRQWCTWMETRFGGISGSSEQFKKYLQQVSELGGSDSDMKKAIDYYKDFLTDEYAHLSLSLTPSIVKLGLDKKERTKSKEQFRKDLEGIPVGISEDLQFVPLSAKSFDKGSSHAIWVKSFSKAYDEYKKSVIEPIASWCKHANSLLYFVDVLELLKRGPEVYNSEKRFAEQALGFFKHTEEANVFMKIIAGAKDMFVTHIDSCYVIATKSDCVCKQGNNMARLAKNMTEQCVKTMGLAEGRTGYLSCAAVSTSDIYEEERCIRARIRKGKDPTGKDIIEQDTFLVDEVPSSWPESDKWPKKFNWQTTFPMFDLREDVPPRQTGLDVIIRNVLAIPNKK